MEPAKHFLALYHRMRLTVYRRLLHRTGRLSAADAIAADVIYLLERPTLTQFAGEMGISQPSATYRVNELAQKGVIEKIPSPRDKRECRLQVGMTTAAKRWRPPAASSGCWASSAAALPRSNWIPPPPCWMPSSRHWNMRRNMKNDRSV